MQMFKRLLLIITIVVLSSGCAKPPVAELSDVRSIVAHTYASGAAQYAPGEYQLAGSALQAAEQQVVNGEYRKALQTLELARRYSKEALNLTLEYKEQLVLEQKKLAEEKRLEELKKQRELEQQRQAELKKQLESKKSAIKKILPILPESKPVDQIEVQAGENLATIAARAEVYKDALLWPLIYKANRDQIKDPEEIFAGQILMIPHDKTREEKKAARRKARELDLFNILK
jgi:nucleoid-associated protein YgaU